jgi:hypothetical protein
MIDLEQCDPKQLLTMRKAAELMPRLRRDRPVTAATVWRWATYGLRGIRLETIQVGGVRCTSRAAMQEFCEAVKAAREADAKYNGAAETPEQAQKRRPKVRKKLLPN